MEAGAQMMGKSLFVRREYGSHTWLVVYVSASPDKHTQGRLVQHFPKQHLLAPPPVEAHAHALFNFSRPISSLSPLLFGCCVRKQLTLAVDVAGDPQHGRG
jgi:hypothetical protein